ncbi:hypothetical protein EVAR_54424_1 [Eumeta japonica]|uniref:Uncharacterized protein n=1 Tax=Eumeta variegata TaxID=151549 RepID=A0A4C1Y661_EUMVA|nr:hypothetical protein EVAR_54424_1 [Eumeta japonica]
MSLSKFALLTAPPQRCPPLPFAPRSAQVPRGSLAVADPFQGKLKIVLKVRENVRRNCAPESRTTSVRSGLMNKIRQPLKSARESRSAERLQQLEE